MDRLFSEKDMDDHIATFQTRFKVKIRLTKTDMPDNAMFSEQEVKAFNDNVALMSASQQRVTRKPLVK